MAIRKFYWRGNGGGVKSDYDDGRNWVDDDGIPYAEAVYPGTGAEDHAWFDSQLVAGALGCTTNCDRTADTALLTFRVTSAYKLSTGNGTGDIGTLANPLIVDVTDEVSIDALYCGNIYLRSAETSLANVKTIGSYTGKTISLDGTIDGLQVFGGNPNIVDSATISSYLYVGSAAGLSGGASLTIGTGVTLPSVITVTGGTTVCESEWSTITMIGGTWEQQGDMTACLYQSGGTFTWTSGNITEAYVSGGTLDGSASNIARTISKVHYSGNGVVNLNNSARNISVTDYLEYLGGSGSVILPIGQRIALTI